jgi:hypothetical protein
MWNAIFRIKIHLCPIRTPTKDVGVKEGSTMTTREAVLGRTGAAAASAATLLPSSFDISESFDAFSPQASHKVLNKGDEDAEKQNLSVDPSQDAQSIIRQLKEENILYCVCVL